MGMSGQVQLAIERGLARLTLDSPDKLNAISVAMWDELGRHCAAIAEDNSVRCVLLQGAQGQFAAGADIAEFPQVRFDESSGRGYHLALMAPALHALRTLPMPVVAAIEGSCIGGGLEIALACDLRVARSDARFGAPVGRLGFPFALPELKVLLDLVGPAVAADLLLAGRLLDGDEAERKGLVQRAVAPAQFALAVEETVAGVLAGSPLAARLNKANILRLMEGGPISAKELDASFGFFGSADYAEGVAAFLQRRPPQFTGR
jgi:enoyl-CoA hydratase/carnithine racemase